MVASTILLGFGIKEVMVTSKVLNSAAAAAEFWTLNIGIKEVLVVRNLNFAGWYSQKVLAAKWKNPNYDFEGCALL